MPLVEDGIRETLSIVMELIAVVITARTGCCYSTVPSLHVHTTNSTSRVTITQVYCIFQFNIIIILK